MNGPTSQQAEALLALFREGIKELRRLNRILERIADAPIVPAAPADKEEPSN